MSDPRHEDVKYLKRLVSKQGKLIKSLKVELAKSKRKEFDLLFESFLCSCEARFAGLPKDSAA